MACSNEHEFSGEKGQGKPEGEFAEELQKNDCGQQAGKGSDGSGIQGGTENSETNPYLVDSSVEEEPKAIDDGGDVLPRGRIFHERSTPLPTRIKSGQITEEKLIAETANDVITVPWQDVEHVALGMIIERVTQEAAAYKVQKLIQSATKLAGNNDPNGEQGKIISYKTTNFLDLYCAGHDETLRFDSSSINYRGFLQKKFSAVSFQNFFRLVREICMHSKSARFSQSIKYFLLWQRDKIKTYEALHDFENDTFLSFTRNTHMVNYEDLNFDRQGWADGWEEER